jgi:hypothetical protein
MQKPALLKVTNRFGVERSLALEKPLFTIGRKAENDLQLLSDTVSRQHAEIIYEDDTYVLVDRSSKRGSYVNDQRIERCALQHLDVIRIGGDDHHKIQFIDETMNRAEAIFNSHPSLRLSMSGARAASANEELQKLARYVEVNQAFKFSLTPDDVLTLIVDAAIEMTQAERGFLMLRNEHGDLEFKVARDNNRNWLVGNDFDTSRTVVEASFRQNRSIIIDDSKSNELLRKANNTSQLESRSIACIPLRHFSNV